MTPLVAARAARRELQALARPAGVFDASRYFRGDHGLRFLNIGTPRVRALARTIRRQHERIWSVDEAVAFADELMRDRELEAKGLGIEVLAGYRGAFRPDLLLVWRRWLADGLASNWATTDLICGMLIGPLLVVHPELAGGLRAWTGHPSLWVRRAAAVALIPSVRTGAQLTLAYQIAGRLHPDPADLIQKAVGWLLREAGKRDAARLERYLLDRGPSIPRTTVRYAIERFPPATRRRLLSATA
ncbi:MAG: DNA alkylation repair protein [Vicinamibacterales bacterium]